VSVTRGITREGIRLPFFFVLWYRRGAWDQSMSKGSPGSCLKNLVTDSTGNIHDSSRS
jgi:hypothetical protein